MRQTSQKRYKYVGKERDEETGLYYYGARYYAAWLCRFVSVDPLQFDYPYYTPFQYAGNKPITYIDLDGLMPWPIGKEYKGYTRRLSPTRRFGMQPHPINKNPDGTPKIQFHSGVDMDFWGNGKDLGAPIYSTHDGEIAKINRKKTGGGNEVIIQSPDGSFQTFYSHLDEFAEGVKVGTKIKEGDKIGTMGTTGSSTGEHLHYGIKILEEGIYVYSNPLDKNGNLFDPQEWVRGSARYIYSEFKSHYDELTNAVKNGEISPDEYYFKVDELTNKYNEKIKE